MRAGKRIFRLSRRGIVAGAVGAGMAVAIGSVAWACTVPVGFTWYSDGSSSKSGPAGTVITAFATQARASQDFNLVIGESTEPGHEGHACMNNFTNINPNNRRSSASGFIGNTSGPVNRTPGVWQICFREMPSGQTSTIPVSFTII